VRRERRVVPDGTIWQHLGHGRNCEVKMVKGGWVRYRYLEPREGEKAPYFHKMKFAQFLEAFEEQEQ